MTTEQEKMFLENTRLVYYLVERMGIDRKNPEFDDLAQIGMIGLLMAVRTFDKSKGKKFSTYASRCIQNEIFMYFRKMKKISTNMASLDKPVGSEMDEMDKVTLLETIPDKNAEFISKMEIQEDFIKTVNIILNCVCPIEIKLVLLYYIGGLTQHKIAKMLNISQSYVSRLQKSGIKKVREVYKREREYTKKYSMSIQNDEYVVFFEIEDMDYFEAILMSILDDMEIAEKLLECKIEYNKNGVAIKMPANLSSFVIVARIIQEIESE